MVAGIVVVSLGVAGQTQRSLEGTWCIDGEDVRLTFTGTDSVVVSSTSEEGINGSGSYTALDTMFVAQLISDELEIRMGYTYDWTSDSTLAGRPLFLTLNGDSLDVPAEAVIMTRCDR